MNFIGISNITELFFGLTHGKKEKKISAIEGKEKTFDLLKGQASSVFKNLCLPDPNYSQSHTRILRFENPKIYPITVSDLGHRYKFWGQGSWGLLKNENRVPTDYTRKEKGEKKKEDELFLIFSRDA